MAQAPDTKPSASNRRWAVAYLCAIAMTALLVTFQPVVVPFALVFLMASVLASRPPCTKFLLLLLAAYTPVEPLVLDRLPDSVFLFARFAFQGLMLGALAGVMIRRGLEGRPVWVRNPVDLPLAIFLTVSALSFLVNRPPLASAIIAYQPFLRYILVAYFLVLLTDYTERDARLLTNVMLIVAVLESLLGIAQSMFSDTLNPLLTPVRGEFGTYVMGGFSQTEAYRSGYQIFATLGRYNALGLFLAYFLVLTIPFFHAYPKRRPFLFGFFAVAGLCVFLTASRGALLFVGAGAMAVFAAERRWKLLLVPAGLFVGLFVVGLLMPDRVRFMGYEEATTFQRMLEVFDPFYLYVTSEYGRLFFILRFPVLLLTKGGYHALLGYGPGALDWRAIEWFGQTPLNALGIAPDRARTITDVNWAYILGQSGFIGLAIMVWMCARLFRACLRFRDCAATPYMRSLTQGFIGVLAGHCAAGFVAPIWEWRYTSLYFWLYAGIVVSHGLRNAGAENRADNR